MIGYKRIYDNVNHYREIEIYNATLEVGLKTINIDV